MVGERALAQPREVVWDALNDMDVLKACIPGCDSIVHLGGGKYEVSMQAAIGPIKAKFKGAMTISDLHPPSGYSLTFEGAGGAAGFARGDAHVELLEVDSHNTLLRYRSDATVGGKLAQIGARLVDSAARVMSNRFFDAFAKALEAPIEPSESASASTTQDSAPSEDGTGLRRMFRKLKSAG